MTKKKIRAKVAKMFRIGVDCDFITSVNLSKKFLKNEMTEYSNENYNLGFVYELERDHEYNSSLTFQGKISCKDCEYTIPHEAYELQDLYRYGRIL